MKSIFFHNLKGEWVTIEIGKRLHALGDLVSDIILDDDQFIIVYGPLFKVYKGIPYEYEEMHATKNPYQYKNRDKNI